MATAFTIAVFIVWLTPLIVAAYSLYTVITEDSATINDKAIWSLLVVFVPIIGLLVWFIAVRPYFRERAALHHAFPQYTQEQIHAYQAHLEQERSARKKHTQRSQHHGGLTYAPPSTSAHPTSQFAQQPVTAPTYTTYEGPVDAHPATQQHNTVPQQHYYQSSDPNNSANNTANNTMRNNEEANAYDNNLVVDEGQAEHILNPDTQTITTYTKFSDLKRQR